MKFRIGHSQYLTHYDLYDIIKKCHQRNSIAKKKAEPIISLGRDTDNLTVQKSHPLFALCLSELTLSEFKILDTYLSHIDSHKPDKRTVEFGKGELEELLGVKKINVVKA